MMDVGYWCVAYAPKWRLDISGDIVNITGKGRGYVVQELVEWGHRTVSVKRKA